MNTNGAPAPRLGAGWWLWGAVVATVTLTVLAVVVWAIIRFTAHYTGGC